MLRRKSLYVIALLFVIAFAPFTFSAKPKPPKNMVVATQDYKNVVDNSWTNLEFSKNVQPAGLYYIEMSNLVGTIGCWGSRKNPYEDGPNGELLTAWRDDEPLEDGKADFRLQYRPTKLKTWVELIVIAPQAAISDIWFPFGLQDAKNSIGQTFVAPDPFDGVGLQTPTWVTNNSGCTLTLYSAEGTKQAVKVHGELATSWGSIKSNM